MPEPAAVPPPPAGRRAGRAAGLLAAAVLVGALAAPLATHTWPSTAVTAAIGLVVVGAALAGWPRRVGGTARIRARAAAPWALVFVAFAVLEIGALAWGDRPSFPTLSWLLGPYFVDPAVRFGGYVLWIVSGYWLVRR